MECLKRRYDPDIGPKGHDRPGGARREADDL